MKNNPNSISDICTVALALVSISIFATTAAAQVTTTTTKVKEIFSYADYGSGDLILTVDDPIEGCTGFWIDGSNPGAKNVTSVALSAYHTSSPVLIYADEKSLFPGSGASYCKLKIIRLRAK